MQLTSINNEKVKYWEKLKLKKYRDKEKLFLVEDEHLVKEAIKKNIVEEIITITEENYPFKTYNVTKEIMKKISSQETSAKVIAVCRMLEKRNIKNNILVLDNLQDPGNLGTIIRSAVAFNFDSIILSDDSVDLYNPKVVRASEGMLFHINIIRCNIKEFLDNLNDYLIVGTDVVNGEDIKKINKHKIALVIGNEGKGISDDIRKLCHKFVNIKMNDKCESLNASVSASILMYEVNNG